MDDGELQIKLLLAHYLLIHQRNFDSSFLFLAIRPLQQANQVCKIERGR